MGRRQRAGDGRGPLVHRVPSRAASVASGCAPSTAGSRSAQTQAPTCSRSRGCTSWGMATGPDLRPRPWPAWAPPRGPRLLHSARRSCEGHSAQQADFAEPGRRSRRACDCCSAPDHGRLPVARHQAAFEQRVQNAPGVGVLQPRPLGSLVRCHAHIAHFSEGFEHLALRGAQKCFGVTASVHAARGASLRSSPSRSAQPLREAQQGPVCDAAGRCGDRGLPSAGWTDE